MDCPECGECSCNFVVRTYDNPDHKLRVRQCKACGQSWTTEERVGRKDNQLFADLPKQLENA